ncbi:hypothetical protein Mapa_004559 [Marchantia paleacea]|nr:hypothetical protein Mapa_004559 [Marchantia paleacea]
MIKRYVYVSIQTDFLVWGEIFCTIHPESFVDQFVDLMEINFALLFQEWIFHCMRDRCRAKTKLHWAEKGPKSMHLSRR